MGDGDASLRGPLERLTFEVVPVTSIETAILELPPRSRVSVTVSATKGNAVTIEVARRLAELGHDAIPHVAARLIDGPGEIRRITGELAEAGIAEIFLVGGDVAEPRGRYRQGSDVLEAILDGDHGLTRVGVPGYPDGHPLIAPAELERALQAKQQLLVDAGIGGWVATQMCFDGERIAAWLRARRDGGLALPVDLGLAGVVDRTKLLALGPRIGVGASLRYLRKNRSVLRRLVTAAHYSPSEVFDAIAGDLVELGVEGLHVFTFNQVGRTEAWRRERLAAIDAGGGERAG